MLYKVKDLHEIARVTVVNEIENDLPTINRVGKTHFNLQPHGMCKNLIADGTFKSNIESSPLMKLKMIYVNCNMARCAAAACVLLVIK